MRYEYESIKASLDANEDEKGFSKATLSLTKGDYAWNPGSTKRDSFITGPAKVRYERYVDGGITAFVD